MLFVGFGVICCCCQIGIICCCCQIGIICWYCQIGSRNWLLEKDYNSKSVNIDWARKILIFRNGKGGERETEQ